MAMLREKHLVRLFFVLSLSFVTACTSVPTDDLSAEALRSTLEVGDLVEITTKGGDERNFIIVELNEVGIVGVSSTVPYQEIEEIRAERRTGAGTAVEVLAATGYVAAAAYLFIWPMVALLIFLAGA